MDKLPVIFRAERSGQFKGQVTAVFPTQPGTNSPATFTVYAHIGQHGSGSLDWYRTTRPASDAESAPLLAELRGIYGRSLGGEAPVELVPCKRITAKHTAALLAELRR